MVAATAIGVYELWPKDRSLPPSPGANPLQTERAAVSGIRRERCPVPGARECLRVTAELETGPDEGTETSLAVVDPSRQVGLDVGDKVRLLRNPLPPGASVGGVRADRYSLSDFERRMPLLWLALAFAVVVIAAGRWKGARALAGLGLSLAIVVGFIVPARGALGVGHDHIAATVNTLFLAYAGASLPVLLIFNLSETSFSDALNNEAVAAEVVATLVGSIGLIAAVPVTTAIASLLATQSGGSPLPTARLHAH